MYSLYQGALPLKYNSLYERYKDKNIDVISEEVKAPTKIGLFKKKQLWQTYNLKVDNCVVLSLWVLNIPVSCKYKLFIHGMQQDVEPDKAKHIETELCDINRRVCQQQYEDANYLKNVYLASLKTSENE